MTCAATLLAGGLKPDGLRCLFPWRPATAARNSGTISEPGFRYLGPGVRALALVPSGKGRLITVDIPAWWTFFTNHARVLLTIVRDPASDCGTSPQRARLPNAPLSQSLATSNRPVICAGNGWGGATDTRSSVTGPSSPGRVPPARSGTPGVAHQPRRGHRASLTEQLSRSGSCSASSSSHIDPADDLADVVLHSGRVAYPKFIEVSNGDKLTAIPRTPGSADPTDDQLRPTLGR
jgi:hypothetical protein